MDANRFIEKRFDGGTIPRKLAEQFNDLKKRSELAATNIYGSAVMNIIHCHKNAINAIVNVYKVAPLLAAAPHFKRIFFLHCTRCNSRNGVRKILIFSIT